MTGPCVTYSESIKGRLVVVSCNRDMPGSMSIRFDGQTLGGVPVAAARAIVTGIAVVEAEIRASAAGGAV